MNQNKSILIITFCIPWPVADGGKMYVYTSVNYLRNYYSITLLLNVYNQADLTNVAFLKTHWPNVNIQTVNYIKQLGTKEKLKKKLRDFYYNNFSKKATAEQEHVFFNLRKKITNIFLLSNNFLFACEALFANHTFDIVQVEYSTNIGAINFIPKGPVKIYVEIESLYSIMEDFMAINGDHTFINTYLVNCAKNIELDFMKRYDAVLALNQGDHNRIGNHLPGQIVFTSPYAVMDSHFSKAESLQNWQPQKLIFIGSESHYPNKDAVEWYISEIMPLLKDSQLKLYITGAWSDGFKAKWKNINNVMFTGFVTDLSEQLTNSIMIVPIRLGGGGIRAKVIQAMAFGVPIVTTLLGCAGIVANDDKSMLIRNDAAGFACAIDQLAANANLGSELLQASYIVAKNSYSETVAGTLRHGFYQQLLLQKANAAKNSDSQNAVRS